MSLLIKVLYRSDYDRVLSIFFSSRIVNYYVSLYQILAVCSERFYSVFRMKYRYLIVFLAQNAQDG